MNISIEERILDQYKEIEDEKEGFGIDLEYNFSYTLAEIEYMAKEGENLQEVTQKIIKFAKKHKIDSDVIIRGKGAEYLRRYNSKHFQALINAGVLK